MSATTTVLWPVSDAAMLRPAIGAIAGPEFRAWIGASATSRASATPPFDVETSSLPAKPASLRRRSRPWRYSLITGLSEASMTVADARRYSLRIGLSLCDSVQGCSGACSASSSPTRSS